MVWAFHICAQVVRPPDCPVYRHYTLQSVMRLDSEAVLRGLRWCIRCMACETPLFQLFNHMSSWLAVCNVRMGQETVPHTLY